MTPTPLKDLAGYMDKQVIACVEGTITKIQDKIARGTGNYGDWAMQFSTIRDASGTFHDLVITDENSFLQNGVQGLKITLESQPQSKGGPAGVSMGVRFKDGKENRSIKVDNRAKITLGGSGGSPPSQSAPTQGRAVSVQSGPIPEKLPVRNRVNLYLNILAEVHAQRRNRKDLPDITPSDEKDIATHISMTYDNRENYQSPLFKKPEVKIEPEPQPESDFSGGFNPDDDDVPFLCAWKELGSGVF